MSNGNRGLFLALTAARALSTCDPGGASGRLVELFERFGAAPLQRYPVELDRLMTAEAPPARSSLSLASGSGLAGIDRSRTSNPAPSASAPEVSRRSDGCRYAPSRS